MPADMLKWPSGTRYQITREESMKESILEIVVCPVCKGALKLQVGESKEKEIISGSLTCEKCDHTYSINEGIPNLLPPGMNC
jgi:uncharacterized protein YbaR (Trm112 family)